MQLSPVFSSSRCIGNHSYDSLNNIYKGKDRKQRKVVKERRVEEKREGVGREKKEQHSFIEGMNLENFINNHRNT